MAKRRRYEIDSRDDLIRRISAWVVDIVLVVLLALFLTWAFGTRTTMKGSSMAPLLSSNDKLLLDRTKGRLFPIRRFDIAAFSLGEEDSISLKLVLGLPGETVQIREGRVYIDNELLEDERLGGYITNAGIAEDPIPLGEGEYFMIGRSPDTSHDSRFADVGNIPADRILGTVWLRYAPFSGFGFVREEAVQEEMN